MSRNIPSANNVATNDEILDEIERVVEDDNASRILPSPPPPPPTSPPSPIQMNHHDVVPVFVAPFVSNPTLVRIDHLLGSVPTVNDDVPAVSIDNEDHVIVAERNDVPDREEGAIVVPLNPVDGVGDVNDESNGSDMISLSEVVAELDTNILFTRLVDVIGSLNTQLDNLPEIPSITLVRSAILLCMVLATNSIEPTFFQALLRQLRELSVKVSAFARAILDKSAHQNRLTAAFNRLDEEDIDIDTRTMLIESLIPTISDDIYYCSRQMDRLLEELAPIKLYLQTTHNVMERIGLPTQVVLKESAFDQCTEEIVVPVSKEKTTCPICLCDLSDESVSVCRIRVCGHMGCKDCMRTLFTEKCRRPMCPICRADVREGCEDKSDADLSRHISSSMPTPDGDDTVPSTPPITENPTLFNNTLLVTTTTLESDIEADLEENVRRVLALFRSTTTPPDTIN